MSRRFGLFFLCMLGTLAGHSQSFQVSIAIDPELDTARISPYVYGTNGQSNDRGLNITARRLGGNRMTGYNWENNASNMGMDYNQSNANDNYMTWVMGIPANKENIPGITLTSFHDTSVAMGCYSLITLPAAGYVSRDKNGSVPAGQTAPSGRFRVVVPRKVATLSISPDTSDGFVYVEEEVNFLKQRYGSAGTATGVKGYDVDNEPALWPSTHPRIHASKTTCMEVIAKTVTTAQAVKSVDPDAEVFGGVFYGFSAYNSFQDAPDYAPKFSSQGWFINGFLKALHDSSIVAGTRLLDVLDLHWYPDLYTPIVNGNVDSATVSARLQAPRSLWDSSYVESGWIGQWYSPVSMIRNVQTSITKNYPGTKLSISEYDYGASTHISGGIAQADVLGVFGAYRVYMATHWGAIDGFLRAAYAVFRNYDGYNGSFGDMHVRATTTNAALSSAYAATRSADPNTLDLVLINKDVNRTMQASVTIAGAARYRSARVFGFDGTHQAVAEFSPLSGIAGNAFTASLPPLSVRHLVLSAQATGVEVKGEVPQSVILEQNYPNPFNPTTTIRFNIGGVVALSGAPLSEVEGRTSVKLSIYDMLGREVAVLDQGMRSAGRHEVRFDGSHLSSGAYFYRLTAGGRTLTRSMLIVK